MIPEVTAAAIVILHFITCVVAYFITNAGVRKMIEYYQTVANVNHELIKAQVHVVEDRIRRHGFMAVMSNTVLAVVVLIIEFVILTMFSFTTVDMIVSILGYAVVSTCIVLTLSKTVENIIK